MIAVFSRPDVWANEAAADWARFYDEPSPAPLPRKHFADLIRDIRREFYRLPPELRDKWRALVRQQIADVQAMAPRYWRT